MKTEAFLENNIKVILLLMVLAYLFSMGIRMYWPLYFADSSSMLYAGELMINTNDGYFFSTGARDIINGVTAADAQRASAYDGSPALVLLTAYATKILPFSLDTVSLYLPGIISSLIVIPLILTGRLMGNTLLGFLAALLGSIAWSYYNRTMVGYYDTDMFSVFMQFMVFYSFLQIIYKKSFGATLFSALMVFSYPYFYSQGMTLVYAMYFLLVLYLSLEHMGLITTAGTKAFKEKSFSLYRTVILLSIPLMFALSIEIRLILFMLVLALLVVKKESLKEKELFYMSVLFFVGFLIFSNLFLVIWAKIFAYTDRGLDGGSLQFYQVVQTVREAGAIPFSTMANRISGSEAGVILSLIGYVLLVVRHKAFLIALPLIGVGVFSMWGGLRFTVYAVPVAAFSAIYLFYIIGDFLSTKTANNPEKKIVKYGFIVLATAALIYPNITHIIGYKVPTVLNKAEVDDLVKLDKIASNDDYTITWWDYGYPIWYYSNTNTLIDGGKHTHDNYIVSKILFSDSPQQVANLSKLAIETYVESNYSIVADRLFNDENKTPNSILNELKSKDYLLPKKSRDVYLYLPYRMLRIFPTVGVFGNLNLKTGKKSRESYFTPVSVRKQAQGKLFFNNGTMYDAVNHTVEIIVKENNKYVKKTKKVYRYDTVQYQENRPSLVQSRLNSMVGEYYVVNLQSYGQVVVMDKKTYNSTYVQMFIYGKYDKNLFEQVVSSPYSKIYRVK